MRRTLVGLALLSSLLTACSGGDAEPEPPADPATGASATQSSGPTVPDAASAPVDPCSLVPTEVWRGVLRRHHLADARLTRVLGRDEGRVSAECQLDVGTFPNQGAVVWGYVLNDWGLEDQQGVTGAAPLAEQPAATAEREAEGWGWERGAFAEVHDQLVYVEIVDELPVRKELRKPDGLPTRLLLPLVENAVPGMTAFPVDLPPACPAADAGAVRRLLGEVRYARGFDDYGNADCEYVGTRTDHVLRLSSRNQTDLYWRVDQGLASSLGTDEYPPVGFPVPPGVAAKIYDYGTDRTLNFNVPAKKAYIQVSIETPGRRVRRSVINQLAEKWLTDRLKTLPERRRVR